MMFLSRHKYSLKFVVLVACGVLFAGVTFFGRYSVRTEAASSGPSASHTGAPGEVNCTSCHGEFPVNTGGGSVSISGLPVNYVPGRQYTLTARADLVGATIYGFQLTAIDPLGRRAGTYTLPGQLPARMQVVPGIVGGNQRDYLQHTVDGIIPQQFNFNTWTFQWTAPATRVGKIGFYMAGNGSNSDGSPSGDYIYTTSRDTLSGTATANFDSDTRSDFSVFRPSQGVWYSLNSDGNGFQATQFGANGDLIAPGDYDGDGRTDLALFRPSSGIWFIRKSDNTGFIITQFGSNGDVPVPGDYDGDGLADLAVWRPSNGVWYIRRSSNGSFDIRQFGISTDKVAQNDFDADGRTDIAVFRPSTGDWYVWRSSNNGIAVTKFGLNGDLPVQADYDGDGRADLAVFRPSNGVWYLLRSTAGFTAAQFGASGDTPVASDYDGDGRADVSVFRAGTWFSLRSSDGGATILNFGLSGDRPVAAGLFAP